ncbi:MAG: molybdenum cofactor guanylyltransferase [Fidelibacterota bacterium]
MLIPASGFILIGGRSRRFGAPKWKAKLAGQTLLDRTWKLADSLFRETYVVTKKGQGPGQKPTVMDVVDFRSPLSGIYSVLKTTNTKWNFVLACDLPLISGSVIIQLWKHVQKDVEIVVPETLRGPEPACAFYSRSVLPACEEMIARKDYALHHLIDLSTSVAVDFSREEDRFVNINTPEDLERARIVLEKGSV